MNRMIAFLLILLLTAASNLQAQQPSTADKSASRTGSRAAGTKPKAAQNGMANTSLQKAVFDEQHRPITAGGIVKSGPIVFKDVAAAAGLTSWHHTAGRHVKRLLLEAKGPGVCLIDYDNDGWLDIYLVSGSTFEALAGKAAAPHAALFHNNHDGTFSDTTHSAGVTNERWGYGCAVGDYNNDGWPDLYVTNYGQNRLFSNNHDNTFTDVAEKAGVNIDMWSTGATFGDYDGDGRLDLFVDGYAQIDLANPPIYGSKGAGNAICQFHGVPVMCGPRGLKGEHDHLFHNNGNGTFTDVSKKLGVDDPAGYYGLGVLFADVNNDGKPDLLVGNDSTPNYLYINKGDGTFDNQSYPSGYALNGDGREIANMGIAAGDYENNGRLSIVNTDFANDYNVLFQNDGSGFFSDVSYGAGLADSSIPFVGFGDGFLDYDNDGWKDLLIVNGHVYPEVDRHPEWGQSYAQRPLLYRNLKNGKFEMIPPVAGTGLAAISVARGAAFGDIFNEGKISAVVNNMDGIPVLLRNVSADHHHWVDLKLMGGAGSPRDAVGATLYLDAAGMRQRGDVLSGGSYLSSNDMRVHFGLADSSEAGSVEIHWPSGAKETVKLPSVDRIFTIEESKGIIGELCTGCDGAGK
jgi:enediyne biosynthesis protein E4